MIQKQDIDALNQKFASESPETLLRWFLEQCEGKIALSSSLGPEDQVLTDMIVKINKNAQIFTLDTGRLFPETYSLIEKTNMRYGIKIRMYFPDFHKVEDMVSTHGINLFYESIEKRKLCCALRKLEPLSRAFKGLDAWICGLRREQSVTRQAMQLVEWDEIHNIIKINPLIHWSEQQVWDYISKNAVPYNRLHKNGFPSIGCQPCTRAVKEGEDARSGRWWWESPEHRECGLHKK
ncbi:MAG: phosphoadenylyl-sulfate reductase [Bacteroidales bacterium]|jgi:phosphoadenosine phosphosulfate reductase|nr:phosphoadenylyl-sulfate reductase [Bacteroidales bacterium]